MLNNLLITLSVALFYCISAAAVACNKKSIQQEILGKELFSLYDDLAFISILDNSGEFADLNRGEKYWLAIDSRHENLTLRTENDKVLEVIIRNPDLVTEKGIGVGATLEKLREAYPKAVKLTHYSNGVKRQWDVYYLTEENIEVNFNSKGIVKDLRLKKYRIAKTPKDEALIVDDDPSSNDNLQRYNNVLSTYTDCEGKPNSAWVVVSPDSFPKSLKGMSATLKFQVGDDSKPYAIGLVDGSSEIAEWSKKSLLKGKFPNKPSSCWKVKYEYIDEASTEN